MFTELLTTECNFMFVFTKLIRKLPGDQYGSLLIANPYFIKNTGNNFKPSSEST
jgi:hypothetical protein